MHGDGSAVMNARPTGGEVHVEGFGGVQRLWTGEPGAAFQVFASAASNIDGGALSGIGDIGINTTNLQATYAQRFAGKCFQLIADDEFGH